MTAKRPVLDLTPGAQLTFDGLEWMVESFEPWCGRVVLRRAGDTARETRQTTVHELLSHPESRQVGESIGVAPGSSTGRQAAMVDDLSALQRRQLALRVAHMLEAETGFRSGDPVRAAAGEPRPDYDPATTTLQQRRQAKVAELARRDRSAARLLGLDNVSERTLRRWAAAYRRFGVLGCVDGRLLRRSGDRPSITEQIREAIHAVHRESLHRAKISMRTKERLIHQYVRERFGPEVPIPCYQTLRSVWIEWFGPGAPGSGTPAPP